ncbi:hypothetical protein SRHO_G00040400 [Serrasalmus rhombeus]
MKKIDVNGKPHLCLFALNDIKEGEEVTYDYGGEDCPWRTKVGEETANDANVENSNHPFHLKTGDEHNVKTQQISSIQADTMAACNFGRTLLSKSQMDDATGPTNTTQQTSSVTDDAMVAHDSRPSHLSKSQMDDATGPTNTTQQNASEFQDVHQEKWNELISATALRNIREAKWNVPTLMPFTEDVQKMHAYLTQVQDEWYNSLSESPSTKAWMELAKVCLAQIIVFNRRREGEVASMPLSAFSSRDTSDPHVDVDWALSEVEKKLCRHFSRIVIRGQRGRPVPILLTPKMLGALELLVKQREACGVLKDNGYMFARPEAMTHFRGSDCIRGFAKACGARCPESLTSTRLRKHAATLSTVLNMTDTEMDQLANFLGHDIRIHREFYRLPEKTLQLAKISKVLMALEQGRLAEFHGKNLDEIGIDPDEKILDSDEDTSVQEEKRSSSTSTVDEPSAEESLSPTKKNEMPPPPPKKYKPLSDEDETPSRFGAMRHSSKGKATQKKKRPWKQPEVQAVERHMNRFITACTVPAKSDLVLRRKRRNANFVFGVRGERIHGYAARDRGGRRHPSRIVRHFSFDKCLHSEGEGAATEMSGKRKHTWKQPRTKITVEDTAGKPPQDPPPLEKLKCFQDILDIVCGLSDEEWRALTSDAPHAISKAEFASLCTNIMISVGKSAVKSFLPTLIHTLGMEAVLTAEEQLRKRTQSESRSPSGQSTTPTKPAASSHDSDERSTVEPSAFICTMIEDFISEVKVAMQEAICKLTSCKAFSKSWEPKQSAMAEEMPNVLSELFKKSEREDAPSTGRKMHKAKQETERDIADITGKIVVVVLDHMDGGSVDRTDLRTSDLLNAAAEKIKQIISSSEDSTNKRTLLEQSKRQNAEELQAKATRSVSPVLLESIVLEVNGGSPEMPSSLASEANLDSVFNVCKKAPVFSFGFRTSAAQQTKQKYTVWTKSTRSTTPQSKPDSICSSSAAEEITQHQFQRPSATNQLAPLITDEPTCFHEVGLRKCLGSRPGPSQACRSTSDSVMETWARNLLRDPIQVPLALVYPFVEESVKSLLLHCLSPHAFMKLA